MRVIKSMEELYLQPALELVERVFTEHSNEEEGKLVRSLVEEIRSKRFYIPELELIMVDETDEVIGYVMLSRFHLDGKKFAQKNTIYRNWNFLWLTAIPMMFSATACSPGSTWRDGMKTNCCS